MIFCRRRRRGALDVGAHDGAPRSYPAAKIIAVKWAILCASWYYQPLDRDACASACPVALASAAVIASALGCCHRAATIRSGRIK